MAGVPGAVAAPVGVFLPVYLFAVVPFPFFDRISGNARVKAFVADVTAAALADLSLHRSDAGVPVRTSGRLGRSRHRLIVNYDKDGKLYPVIAKEIPRVSNGGKTFEVKIRDGAKFHNGRQIVADDVKYSLERVALKENKSWGIAYVGNVVGLKDYQERKIKELPAIKVVHRMTVVIDFETPSANYFNYLTMSTNAPVPREEVEKPGAEWGKKVVGSGPFVCKEWAPGKKFSMVKNPDYRDKSLPLVDAVEYEVGIDNALQLLRVEKGELDLSGARGCRQASPHSDA